MICNLTSGDFNSTGFSFAFEVTSGLTTVNYEYDLGDIVFDDQEEEEEEGFILYFDFDQTAIHPDDYSRLQIGNGTILVRITDNDGCE